MTVNGYPAAAAFRRPAVRVASIHGVYWLDVNEGLAAGVSVRLSTVPLVANDCRSAYEPGPRPRGVTVIR